MGKRIDDYWKQATKYVAEMKKARAADWVPVELGDEALNEWVRYFRSVVGELPYGLTLLLDGKIESFSVPAKNPWDFDLKYTPPQTAAPVVKKKKIESENPSLEVVARVQNMARHFKNQGGKLIPNLFVPDNGPWFSAMVQRREREAEDSYYEKRRCDDDEIRNGLWVPAAWMEIYKDTRTGVYQTSVRQKPTPSKSVDLNDPEYRAQFQTLPQLSSEAQKLMTQQDAERERLTAGLKND